MYRKRQVEWEDNFEVIDLLDEGSFIAVRRQIWNGGVVYEGCFRDSTGERKAAYLDVITEGNNPNLWIQYWIIPRRYEVYEDLEDGTLHFFIYDDFAYLEFYAAYTDSIELHRVLSEFHSTGSVADWDLYWTEEDSFNEESAWDQLRKCRRNSDRFCLVADQNRTYLRKRYEKMLQRQQNK